MVASHLACQPRSNRSWCLTSNDTSKWYGRRQTLRNTVLDLGCFKRCIHTVVVYTFFCCMEYGWASLKGTYLPLFSDAVLQLKCMNSTCSGYLFCFCEQINYSTIGCAFYIQASLAVLLGADFLVSVAKVLRLGREAAGCLRVQSVTHLPMYIYLLCRLVLVPLVTLHSIHAIYWAPKTWISAMATPVGPSRMYQQQTRLVTFRNSKLHVTKTRWNLEEKAFQTRVAQHNRFKV